MIDGKRYGLLFVLLAFTAAAAAGCSTWGGKMRNTEGVRYYSNGQYDEALESFQTASRLNPDDPEIYYNLASTYQQQATQMNQPALLTQAENYYRLCLEKNPNAETTVCCYRGLATVLNQKNQKEEAMALLRAWEEKNPTSVEPKLEIAYLLEAQGSYQDAAAALEKIAAYAPNDYRAFYKLGLIQEKLGQDEAALTQLRTASRLNPSDTEISQRIALLENKAAMAGNTAVAASGANPASAAPAANTVPTGNAAESNWTGENNPAKANDVNVAATPAANTAPAISSNPFESANTAQIPQTQAVDTPAPAPAAPVAAPAAGTPAYDAPAAGASAAEPIGSVPSDSIIPGEPTTYNTAPSLPDGTGANPFNLTIPGSASVAPPVQLPAGTAGTTAAGTTAAGTTVAATAAGAGAAAAAVQPTFTASASNTGSNPVLPNASATAKQRIGDPVIGPPLTSVTPF